MIPDSDAHRAGLQEGDQVLAVNDVDFQDIEHSKVRPLLPPAELFCKGVVGVRVHLAEAQQLQICIIGAQGLMGWDGL